MKELHLPWSPLFCGFLLLFPLLKRHLLDLWDGRSGGLVYLRLVTAGDETGWDILSALINFRIEFLEIYLSALMRKGEVVSLAKESGLCV